MEPSDPILEETARLILSTLREDGRFRQAPSGGIYPCQTIHALQVLCHLGLGDDPGLDRSFRHLLEIQWEDGGWRCNKFSYGRGPETNHSNPGPTLTALDAFRLSGNYGTDPRLDRGCIPPGALADPASAGALPLWDRYAVSAGGISIPNV